MGRAKNAPNFLSVPNFFPPASHSLPQQACTFKCVSISVFTQREKRSINASVRPSHKTIAFEIDPTAASDFDFEEPWASEYTATGSMHHGRNASCRKAAERIATWHANLEEQPGSVRFRQRPV